MCLYMYCVYVCMCIYSYILPSFNWWQFLGEVFKYLTSTKLMKQQVFLTIIQCGGCRLMLENAYQESELALD